MRLVFCFLILLSPISLMAQPRVPQSQAEISLSFVPVVESAAPAVVNIYAKRVTQARSSPFRGDPFFDRLFEGFGRSEPRGENSLGSGVILSEDGLVVSNYHVVGEATEISVVLNDRREFDAVVVMSDEASDLALLRLVDAEALPFLSLRDSDTVQVGELVLAIGNPFGVGQTVSSGIVSGLARSGGARGRGLGYFIQTDAPINPGNSGGALVDMDGQLIGVNTRILSRSGGSNGIGFAIPASLVRAFKRQAQEGYSTFQRPWVGGAGQVVDGDLAEILELDRPGGILISAIHSLSPLRDAGFEVGDVILAVDGASVTTLGELVYRMSVAAGGDVAQMDRLRDGEVVTRSVRLINPPEIPARDAVTLPDESVFAGLELARINPAVALEYKLPLQLEGIVVLRAGGGRRIALQDGDVLLRVGNQDIPGSPREAAALLRQLERGSVMRIFRNGRALAIRI